MYNKLSLYHILPTLGSKTPESLVRRLLYALDHNHQVSPLHLVALRVLVILRQLETACLQALHIHHHTPVLGMEQLHQLAALPDENEYIAIAHVTSHLLMHHTAERTDTLTHVSPPWAQPVAHRVVKAEHGSPGFCPTTHEAHPQCRCRNGHGGRWGTEALHQRERHR